MGILNIFGRDAIRETEGSDKKTSHNQESNSTKESTGKPESENRPTSPWTPLTVFILVVGILISVTQSFLNCSGTPADCIGFGLGGLLGLAVMASIAALIFSKLAGKYMKNASQRCFAVAFCIFAALSFYGTIAQAAYAQGNKAISTDYHYSFTVPTGWKAIDQQVLEEGMALANKLTDEGVFYEFGYNAPSGGHFLVQPQDVGGISVEVFSKTIKKYSGEIDILEVPEEGRLEWSFLGNGQKTVAMLGAKNIILIHFYSLPKDTINTIVESFSFDQGYKYNSIHKTLPTDIPHDTWFTEALRSFIEDGVIVSNKAFRPQDLATRAEFLALIVDHLGEPSLSEGEIEVFDDVTRSSPYFPYFREAVYTGLIKGENNCVIFHTSPCRANPFSHINRAEAAAIINRAFDLKPAAEFPSFQDNPSDAWFNIVISNTASRCILRGDQGTESVRPSDNMNRAEMAVMIWRASQKMQYPNCE